MLKLRESLMAGAMAANDTAKVAEQAHTDAVTAALGADLALQAALETARHKALTMSECHKLNGAAQAVVSLTATAATEAADNTLLFLTEEAAVAATKAKATAEAAVDEARRTADAEATASAQATQAANAVEAARVQHDVAQRQADDARGVAASKRELAADAAARVQHVLGKEESQGSEDVRGKDTPPSTNTTTPASKKRPLLEPAAAPVGPATEAEGAAERAQDATEATKRATESAPVATGAQAIATQAPTGRAAREAKGPKSRTAAPATQALPQETPGSTGRRHRDRDRWLNDIAPNVFRNAYLGCPDLNPVDELPPAFVDLMALRDFDFVGHLAFATVFENDKHNTVVGADSVHGWCCDDRARQVRESWHQQTTLLAKTAVAWSALTSASKLGGWATCQPACQ